MLGPLPTEPDSLREIKIGDPEQELHRPEDRLQQPHTHMAPPRVQKSVSNNTLSSRNLSLHDGAAGEVEMDSPLDLDQTTMIGSALDLDSLEGDRSEPQQTSQNGSQVGAQVGPGLHCTALHRAA
jgi:hypothetical protein